MGRGVNVVKSGTCEVKYEIRQHESEGETKFDWLTDVGSESDEWFNSIEEAERDVKNYF